MFKQVDVELNLNLIAEFRIRKGTDQTFSGRFGNWLPGESTSIEDLRVYIKYKNKEIDITKALDKEQIAQIENQCWDNIGNDET